jgi:hypothetical protein
MRSRQVLPCGPWHVLPGVSGHYAAHTHPDVLAADIRAFFTDLRKKTRP